MEVQFWVLFVCCFGCILLGLKGLHGGYFGGVFRWLLVAHGGCFGAVWWLFGVSYWCNVEVGARCRLGAECYACRNFFFMKWVHSKTLKCMI